MRAYTARLILNTDFYFCCGKNVSLNLCQEFCQSIMFPFKCILSSVFVLAVFEHHLYPTRSISTQTPSFRHRQPGNFGFVGRHCAEEMRKEIGTSGRNRKLWSAFRDCFENICGLLMTTNQYV